MRNHHKPWFKDPPPPFSHRVWWNREERYTWIRQDRLARIERDKEVYSRVKEVEQKANTRITEVGERK